MTKPTKKRKQAEPEGSASSRTRIVPNETPNDFDRTVAALFQVPKSALDDAEAARPKRTRRKKDDA